MELFVNLDRVVGSLNHAVVHRVERLVLLTLVDRLCEFPPTFDDVQLLLGTAPDPVPVGEGRQEEVRHVAAGRTGETLSSSALARWSGLVFFPWHRERQTEGVAHGAANQR